MKLLAPTAVALLAATIAGCEAPELPASATASSASTPAAEPATEEEPVMVAGAPGEPLPENENPITDIPRKFNAHDPVQGRRSREASREGYSLGVATTAAAGFYAKHQSMILAIDQANQLYWPQHDFSYPKTHESFMKDVVALALNGIPLPELAPGEEYIYVPEQAEVGLQIRLTPGSSRSKLPSPEPGKEHVYDPQALAAAGIPVPGLEGGASDRAQAPTTPDQGATDAAATEEPSPNIRTRAEQLGERLNSRAEDHGVAPGGLAPVGGLGEDGF
jgi:hypothetical protein